MLSPSLVDLIVIGAGVNGAAVARDGAYRGLQTILMDAQDLCAGTSAASSRLVHGGLRYLEHFEFGLVRESLRERERLIHMAPHLVTPYGLLVPFYRHNHRPGWMLRMGMILYDVLSFDKTTPRHKILPSGEVAAKYPGLNQKDLTGAALYYDAQALDAERIAVEQAIDASAAGATVLTHWRANAISRDASDILVEARDELTGEERTFRTAALVNATGPWVDRVFAELEGTSVGRLMGGTKGSHITVKSFPGAPATGVHYEARRDGRAILVLPIEPGYVLIGSTDIFYEGDPGQATCSDDEISYLLDEVNQLIPTANLTPTDVIHSYSGIRPLPFDPKARTEADVSRDHHVLEIPGSPGVFGVTGGKLTTHCALGKLAIDKVTTYLASRPGATPRRFPKCSTNDLPLPGARTADWPSFRRDFLARADCDPGVATRLLKLYGTRADKVLEIARQEPSLGSVIGGTGDVLAAEVALAMREEFARTLVDVMARRLLLVRRDDAGQSVVEAVAAVCADVGGWNGARKADEVAAFRSWVRLLRPRSVRLDDEAAPAIADSTPLLDIAEVST